MIRSGLVIGGISNSSEYLESICTPLSYSLVAAKASATSAASRFVKYILPVGEEARLPSVLYQNTKNYKLHQDFLTQVFPELFPVLDPETYDNLVGFRARKSR